MVTDGFHEFASAQGPESDFSACSIHEVAPCRPSGLWFLRMPAGSCSEIAVVYGNGGRKASEVYGGARNSAGETQKYR